MFSVVALIGLVGIAIQDPLAPAQSPAPLDVHVVVPAGRPLRTDERIELRLNRRLSAATERIAVVIADVDWTSLFTGDGLTFSYQPGPVRLPSGDVSVTVYLITDPNDWRAVQSTAVRVATPLGFERAVMTPKVSLTSQGPIAERHAPDSNAPSRARFQDAAVTFGLKSEHLRRGVTLETQTNFLAVSNQVQAVQFGTRGADAPLVDLTDYVWRVRNASADLTVGHGLFNPQRHLMSQFPSRGISFTARRARADVTVASLSATNIAGVENFFGVSTTDNRVAFGLVGLELAKRQGGARVEASAVAGARQARAGFSQGQVTDVERTRGVGVRFVGKDQTGRLRVDAGLASSASTVPEDPLLSQEFTLVPVRDRTSQAEYLETGVDVLKNAGRADAAPISLTGVYRFERVDPFFRSIGTSQGIRSDVLQHTAEASGGVGRLSAQVSQSWSRDNLGGVASILTTDTRVTAMSVAMPAGGVTAHASPPQWWPSIVYSVNLSSQVGRSLPQNGGFNSPSQVPDQRNTTHVVRSEWTAGRWRAAYAVNRSLQDNRQEGRQNADFEHLVQQVSAGATAGSIELIGDISRERGTSLELGDITRATRVGFTMNWRASTRQTVRSLTNWSTNRGTSTGRTDIVALDLQYTYSRALRARSHSHPLVQFFARSSWQSAAVESPFVVGRQERSLWTFNVGLTFSVF